MLAAGRRVRQARGPSRRRWQRQRQRRRQGGGGVECSTGNFTALCAAFLPPKIMNAAIVDPLAPQAAAAVRPICKRLTGSAHARPSLVLRFFMQVARRCTLPTMHARPEGSNAAGAAPPCCMDATAEGSCTFSSCQNSYKTHPSAPEPPGSRCTMQLSRPPPSLTPGCHKSQFRLPAFAHKRQRAAPRRTGRPAAAAAPPPGSDGDQARRAEAQEALLAAVSLGCVQNTA